MDSFAELMSITLAFFKIEYTLWDFTFSMWHIFLFSAAASILAWVIGRFFCD